MRLFITKCITYLPLSALDDIRSIQRACVREEQRKTYNLVRIDRAHILRLVQHINVCVYV